MVYVVALTGGIGSGKSTIAVEFARLGVTVIDADVIARQVVEPGSSALAEIAARFGNEILHPDGALNRSALRQRIFNDATERSWLNKLLHPLIQQETQRQLAQAPGPYALWVVPLLVENNLQKQADRVLLVDIDNETQLARTMARDNIDKQHAVNILSTQASRRQRLAIADDIIYNDGTAKQTEVAVAALHHRYLELAISATQED